MLDLLDGWLKHKSDMVNLEAARVICEMKNVPTFQLMRAIGGKWSPRSKNRSQTEAFHRSPPTIFVVSEGNPAFCGYQDLGRLGRHTALKRRLCER